MDSMLARELVIVMVGCISAGALTRAPLHEGFKSGALAAVGVATVLAMVRVAGLV